MTRKEIMNLYEVDEHGIITSPGKFEGEMLYTPHFWDLFLGGQGTIQQDGAVVFSITTEDMAEFPELVGDVEEVVLYEDSRGFVYVLLN